MGRGRATGLVGLLCLFIAAQAEAGSFRCDALPVEVEAPDQSLVGEICTASVRALNFLERYVLHPVRTIRIGVVDYPLESTGHPIYGRFDSRSDRIQVMSLDAILQSVTAPTLYEEALDLELYRSVIAHEVTHAVVQYNSHSAQITTTAQEYLAHATQIAVLPEARRSRIIAAANVGPWESDDVISEVYTAMALTRFAVKCYLHLMAHQEPITFVQML